ncbi:hypothetical protein F383_06365 [Gossypium arboreum]|uniref:Uncharacterized protein n=1 Tax=Gossypium arboreum TaxID=29729 RepID=A0A0B0PAI9_GOSAR|nr:hypothetical protein F383_06365 [Gossypium arboreum]
MVSISKSRSFLKN